MLCEAVVYQGGKYGFINEYVNLGNGMFVSEEQKCGHWVIDPVKERILLPFLSIVLVIDAI